MSYYRKPYYRNRYNNRYNRDNYKETEKKPYKKRHYYNNNYNSRSRSESRSPKRRYSKNEKRKFNMYNKDEYLEESSSSSSSFDNNDFFVDREKTCPFLLRVFYKINGNNPLSLFSGDKFPTELDIYTWEDANLKELSKFIHDALKDTVLGMYDYYKFSRIHHDENGTLLSDEIGNVVINDKRSKLNKNIKKSLKDIGFQIGDFFDINITSTNRKNN